MFSDSADASFTLGSVRHDGVSSGEGGQGAPAAHGVRLRLSAGPQCQLADGRVVELESRDALALAFVALERETTRAILAQRLWPDVDDERARGNLRQRLLRLRRVVGGDLLAAGAMVALAAGVTHDLDQDCEVLAAVAIGEAGGFAGWLESVRAARRARRAERLAAESARAEAGGELAAALEHAQALLTLDPLSEHAYRRVMRLHYLRGDVAAARAAYLRCLERLRRDLDLGPSRETEALLRKIESAAPPASSRAPLPVSVLRPPRLIGRESERTAMAAAWREALTVLLVGEGGAGKSRLLAEFAGADTAATAARPGDAAVPFALAARLLRAVLLRAPDATAAAGGDLGVVLPEIAGDGAGASLARVTRAVLALLAAAHDEGLAAVHVDDLHFADDASVELLQLVLGDENRLRWAFAQRPGEVSARTAAFADALAQARRLVTVPLAPLGEPAMLALIESLEVPQLDAARLAPALVRHTGGNPLFALETIKQMLVDGSAPGTARLPAPAGVAALIARRLKQLSPRALALARVAAVAGVDFSAQIAERILGLGALELVDDWAELEAAHVLRDAAFAHDLVFEATLASVPAAIARELHARVADELEGRGAAAESIAAHRVAAGDARRSVPALRAAAASALAKFQRPLAAQLLERAAQLLEDIGERDEAFREWSAAIELRQAFDTGAGHDAATQRLLALAGRPAQRAEALTMRSIYLHILGRSEEALPLLADALAVARAAQDAGVMARVLNVQGIADRRLGRTDEAIVALQEALAIARRLEARERDDLPAILNNLALAQLEADDHVQAILHFEESARLQQDVLTRARVLNNLAISFEEVGSIERALETRLAAQRMLRGQDGADFARLNLLVSLAACSRYLMRFTQALTCLEQARELAATTAHWRVEDLHQNLAALWIDLGAWRAADAELALVEPNSTLPAPVRAAVVLVRAHYQIARNLDAAASVARAEKLLAGVDERRIWRRLRTLKIRTLAPAPARELALQEMEREAALGNRVAQIPFATLAARAQLALGAPEEALRLAQRAADALKTVQPVLFSPFEVRFTLCEALTATGDPAATDEARKLADDLQQVAAAQVPEAYRGSFLQGVTLHRHIREAAARAERGPKLRLLKG